MTLEDTLDKLTENEKTAALDFLSEIQDICDETFREKENGNFKKWDELTDTQRSEALTRWFCRNVLELDAQNEINAITIGGKNDYGIDLFHIKEDPGERYIGWGQVKFGRDLDYSIIEQEMLRVKESIKHLENCPKDANDAFKHKAFSFIQKGGKDADYKKHIFVIVAGSLNAQAEKLYKEFEQEIEDPSYNNGGAFELHLYDFKRILKHVIDPVTPELELELDGKVLPRVDRLTKRNSIIGFVKGEEIRKLTLKHANTIFSLNPRLSLGKKAITYKPIMDTLNSPDGERFWKLSNGITAVCEELEWLKDNPTTYKIVNLKIVNGRQTTFTLEEFTQNIPNVELPIAIHEIQDRDEGRKISATTNTQNAVKPIDLISDWDEPRAFVRQCKQKFPMFFYERQTMGWQNWKGNKNQIKAGFGGKVRVIDKQISARAYYAYTYDPNKAMMSDQELYSPVSQTHYNKVFKNDDGSIRNVEELFIPHIFNQAFIELRNKWRDQTTANPSPPTTRKNEILGKRIVIYFVLYFIRLSMDRLTKSDRIKIEEEMIRRISNLQKGSLIDNDLIDIVEMAYTEFMQCFDMNQTITWPKNIMAGAQPEPTQIRGSLVDNGKTILPELIKTKDHNIQTLGIDGIESKLRNLITNIP